MLFCIWLFLEVEGKENDAKKKRNELKLKLYLTLTSGITLYNVKFLCF